MKANGYGRESQGSAASIAEQRRLYQARVQAEGWDDAGWYEDAVSASTYGRKAGKVRGDWDQLRGNLGELLWLNESSRGDRKLSTWTAFLEGCQESGTLIYVEQHERYFDIRKAGDWETLARDGVGSEMESRKTSKRVKTGMDRNVREGATHGRIPFGYTRRYEYEHVDGKRRRIVIQEIDPVTGPVVQEIYKNIRAGHSLKGIARDLNSRGIRHITEWDETKIRSLALRALYMGKRVHNTTPSKKIIAETELVDAQWPAIISAEEWYAVYKKLTDPSRLTHKPGGAKHLLSLIAVCGVCGSPLMARYEPSGWKYVCKKATHVMIDESKLDEYVTSEVISFLSDEANYRENETSDDVTEIQGQIAERQAARGRLAEAIVSGMDPKLAGSTDKRLAAEIRELESRARELTVPSALRDLTGRSEDVAGLWAVMPLPAKREVLRLLSGELGPVLLHRSPAGRQAGSVPAAERVSRGSVPR